MRSPKLQRALDESLFPRIQPMESYREAAASLRVLPATVFLKTEVVPLALYQRFQKHFPFNQVRSADAQLRAVRAVKSPFELGLMEQAGEAHRRVLEERVPEMLRECMSEADLCAELFPGVGMVGIENTFVVSPQGGRCITGTHPGLILV